MHTWLKAHRFNLTAVLVILLLLTAAAVLTARNSSPDPQILSANNQLTFTEASDYDKVTSFFLYLYNQYGKDKILDVYGDYTKVQEVYGKSWEQLISEWKSYLGIAASNN